MKTENPNTPIFGTPEEARVAPKFEMPKTSMPGEVAYQLVHDEAMMDGNARLNLATFVTTWMDDYARRVMTENMDKNMIDKTEYPQTAEIERRCVNIIAKLLHRYQYRRFIRSLYAGRYCCPETLAKTSSCQRFAYQ